MQLQNAKERFEKQGIKLAAISYDSPAILKEEERTYRSALERVIAEGRRLHDAKVPVDDAAAKADLGSFAGWTRRAENAAGALKRVYMELDGELKQ